MASVHYLQEIVDSRMTLNDLIDRVLKLDKKATRGPWFSVSPDARGYEFDHRDDESWTSEGYTISPDKNKPGWETDGGYEGYSLSKNNCDLIAEYRTAAVKLAKILELILTDATDDAVLLVDLEEIQKILDEK